jgi:hypothetical protein
MTAQARRSQITQNAESVAPRDHRSQRRFLKVSSMFGLAVAFRPRTIP